MPSPPRVHHHGFDLLRIGGQRADAVFARVRRGLGLNLDGNIRVEERGLRCGVVMDREDLDRSQVVSGQRSV